MLIGIGCLWLIGLPCAYLAGFIMDGGPVGLRLGFVAGVIVATLWMVCRYKKQLLNKLWVREKE